MLSATQTVLYLYHITQSSSDARLGAVDQLTFLTLPPGLEPRTSTAYGSGPLKMLPSPLHPTANSAYLIQTFG